ncbi:MAG: DUF86 domain-containing protein [Firmicutes bacterium]|nr:DUF86 domain-containing protein [Bacillota bacterium]
MADVQRDKLRDKLQVIEERLRRLRDLAARSREVFLADPVLQDAAVRNLQVATEAMIDIAHHLVARLRLGTPKTYAEAVEQLVDARILPEQDRDVLHGMIRFRNRVVHLYDDVDAEEVYTLLQERLTDFERFHAAIAKRFFTT